MIGALLDCVRAPACMALDLIVESAGRLLDVTAGAAESYAKLAREVSMASRLVP